MNSKLSFTIRPPTTSTKPLTHLASSEPRRTSFIPHEIDSSDEDEEEGAMEAVTGFDQSGVQRLHEKPKPSGPLVIPALANRDWRAVARRRKQNTFIPDGLATTTGKDGSQGGLGTRDSLNSGPHATGLVMLRKKDSSEHLEDDSVKIEPQEVLAETMVKVEDSEDDRARRALLASVAGGLHEESFTIDAIPVSKDNYYPPMDETDAYKRDVVTRPDSATLADYERVPVSQFGAALLRGMGWKEGTAASRTRPGLVEPWLPPSRPALLGIGAKERPQEDISVSGRGGFVSKRPEKRYVPVVKSQKGSELPPSRSRSRSPLRSRTVSRVPSSKSASPYPRDNDTDRLPRQRDRDGARNEHSHSRSGRGSDRETKYLDRDSDRERLRERSYQEGTRENRRERERDDWSRTAKDYRRDEGVRQG